MIKIIVVAFISLLSVSNANAATRPSAKGAKIASAARSAFARVPKVMVTGTLFGRDIRTKYSRFGEVSCAYVASAILDYADVGIEIPEECSLRVMSHGKYCGVIDYISHGKVITNSDELIPGDVVLWKADKTGVLGSLCLSGAKNHIGVYVGMGMSVDAYVGVFGAPDMRTVNGRACWKFSKAYRF